MAVLRIPETGKTLTDDWDISECLAGCGIEFQRWLPRSEVSDTTSPAEILCAFASEIAELKQRGGYVTADVIDVSPSTPGLDAMLAKFNREHWHSEDEVRFIVSGHGLFHIRPKDGPVIAIEVEAGDLIRVPRGTFHWFDLCGDRRIRAIRLFQDTSGWTPHYTESAEDAKYQPLCFGQSQLLHSTDHAAPES